MAVGLTSNTVKLPRSQCAESKRKQQSIVGLRNVARRRFVSLKHWMALSCDNLLTSRLVVRVVRQEPLFTLYVKLLDKELPRDSNPRQIRN
jgi:hypothetical protein